MTKTVLILGAGGKIGRHCAKVFADAGWQVRLFDRSRDDMNKKAMGCDVIVNGLNPPAYHDWKTIIPQITGQVVRAARASGAMVIIPGNVYNFGTAPGPWSENTPQRATTRKGRIRIEMEQAYRASGVKTLVLRAGNFIDPNSDTDILGAIHFKGLAKSQITSPGRPDAMQAWCYLPDWARAAVQLAEHRTELSQYEDVPFAGHTFSVEQMKETLQPMLGTTLRVSRFPWWLMTLASPVWELARELNEMRYLWDLDHRLSGEKLARLLPEFTPTELEVVLRSALPAHVNPNQAMPQGRRAFN